MGYRDDFYKAANVIGYTGQVHKNPTVYFFDGKEFGHITQYHPIPLNIGREAVHTSINYTIRNDGDNGGLVEYNDGKKIHPSRNPFVAKKDISADDLALLYQSIIKCPEMKVAADGVVNEQIFNKFDMLDEMDEMNRKGGPGLRHVPPSRMKGSGT
jgi:hypothetical protein